MIEAIKKFFGALPILVWVGIVVAGVVTFMYVDLQLTKAALEKTETQLAAAQSVVEAQQRAIDAVDEVAEFTQQTNAQLRELNRTIMEAEGATEEIPPAVASAWATGIDSLRNNPLGRDTAEPLDMR